MLGVRQTADGGRRRVKKKASSGTIGFLSTFLSFIVLLPAAVRAQESNGRIDPRGMTIETRFPAPAGFVRKEWPADSFAMHLRRLPLKPDGAAVRLFDGRTKPNPGVYVAVVDLPIGGHDLHQCADAVIRLRAEYLFSLGRFDDIRFRFSSGFQAEYGRWRRGERIMVRGNSVYWQRAAAPSRSYADFWKYLEKVFTYAGTASLARELRGVPREDPEIGDVFIQPGHPGHAVIVVDAAVDRQTGRELFLLAQSYMPAQEIQVLANPSDSGLSPWYEIGIGAGLRTPEWIFAAGDRKRFMEE